MPEEVCCICQEPLCEGHTHAMACGHTMHSTCVINWFSRGRTDCPMCRQQQHTEQQENLPQFSLIERGRFLRTRYSRRKNAPEELLRRIGELRRCEVAWKESRKELRQFRAEHKEVLAQHNRLLGRSYVTRTKVMSALRLLGLYNDSNELLPAVTVRRDPNFL